MTLNEEKDLSYYKNLDNLGYVYSINKNKESHTGHELLYLYFTELKEEGLTNLSDNEFNEIMDFSPETLDDGLFKSSIKCNCHRMYMKYSKYMAKKYFIVYGKVSPRFKQHMTKSDIIKGKSGFKNYYPPRFIAMTKEFITKYPLETWGKSINKPKDDNILSIDDKHMKCILCDKMFLKHSLTRHLDSKNHMKKLK